MIRALHNGVFLWIGGWWSWTGGAVHYFGERGGCAGDDDCAGSGLGSNAGDIAMSVIGSYRVQMRT